MAGTATVAWAVSGTPCPEGSDVGEVGSLKAIALTHCETLGRLALGTGFGKWREMFCHELTYGQEVWV